MGQASSHEKKKRGKKGHVDSGLGENDVLRRSLNKNGKKHTTASNKKAKNLVSTDPGEKKHWHRQQRQPRKPKQQPPKPDLADDVKGVLSPRYGIFDDVKPTVCLDEDGVSLSSASSDEEETIPRRSTPSKLTHRSSSRRRLRRTFSTSGRRRSRAAKMAKKNQKSKQTEMVNKGSEEVNAPAVDSEHKEKGTLSADDSVIMLSADDSGCSTLDDHLFQDDSLSEEVLGCLVSRGLEFDSDTSCQPQTPVLKSRRDEGYESLQKIAQSTIPTERLDGTLEQVRQIIFCSSSENGKSYDPPTEIDMTQWTLRQSSPTNDDQLSISFTSEIPLEADGKSSIAGSFSDSGYSTNRQLSERDPEISDNVENINSPDESPAFVDESFNEHFAHVLTGTKTSLFYQNPINSPTASDTGHVTSPLLHLQNALDTSNQTIDAGLVLDESDVSAGTPVSSAITTDSHEHTCVQLDDTNRRNPSEVYV
ncbi:uncharacterized protein LOC135461459 [Liolophura sinensis]|uniref:uncharacterized protein LOC135461459 n=1 Tax=Liolophura sinensis TaxID=3198878 RepID=UPI0031595FCB